MLLTIPEATILTKGLHTDFFNDDGTRLAVPAHVDVPYVIHLGVAVAAVKLKLERAMHMLPKGTPLNPGIAIADALGEKLFATTEETANALYAAVKRFWDIEDGLCDNNELLRFVIAGLVSADDIRTHLNTLAAQHPELRAHTNRILSVLSQLDSLRRGRKKETP